MIENKKNTQKPCFYRHKKGSVVNICKYNTSETNTLEECLVVHRKKKNKNIKNIQKLK